MKVATTVRIFLTDLVGQLFLISAIDILEHDNGY